LVSYKLSLAREHAFLYYNIGS